MTDTPATPVVPPAPSPPPATPAEASARLSTLTADKDWAGKLLAGHGETTKEFHQLSELVAKGDNVDAAMAGVVPSLASGVIPDSGLLLMANVAADLRERGVSDGAIRELLSGQKAPPEAIAAVRAWKAEHMGDAEWTAKYLKGDALAVKQMTLAQIVLTNAEETKL
jgi:hypothetical protein